MSNKKGKRSIFLLGSSKGNYYSGSFFWHDEDGGILLEKDNRADV